MSRSRHIGCTGIDFVGNTRRDNVVDKKVAMAVIEKIASKEEIPHGWDGTLRDYCTRRKWLTKSYNDLKCSPKAFPFMDMIVGTGGKISKQYVLGRMSNLKSYYKCPDLFYTLDSTDWDTLYQINDLFIYCACTSRQNFPIRIVTNPKGGISSKDSKKGINSYDGSIIAPPQFLQQHNRISVLSRELCQISSYFKMHVYQSVDLPHIFFASFKKSSQLRHQLKKHNLVRFKID